MVQHILVGLTDRMGHELVAHHPAVDIEMLHVGLAARKRRACHPTAQAQTGCLVFEEQGVFEKGRAEQVCKATLTRHPIFGPLRAEHLATIVRQYERYIVPHQGKALHDLFEMTEFGLVGAQELAPRRGVVEQIAHGHHRALRQRGGLQLAAIGFVLPGAVGILCA